MTRKCRQVPGQDPRPTVGVLALQGDSGEHAKALVEVGARPVEVRRPADLAGVHALVLPGGESTTVSMLLESSGLLEPLAARLADGMAVLGTCAGMILLARRVLDGRPDQHCLGAIDIDVRRNAFGRQRESFESCLDVSGLDGGQLPAVFIRAPAVERAGPGVEVLASVEMGDGARRAVLCRQGPVMVSSFHPELSADRRLHQLFVSSILEPRRA